MNLPLEHFSKHSYASTQVDIREPLRSEILNWVRANIDPADLASDGIETDPHVTVLYGLTEVGEINDRDWEKSREVWDVVRRFKPGMMVLGMTSLFESDSNPDVLKLGIESKDLHELHKALSLLPNENSHPEYIPHLTLAYLKKGRGAKYASQVLPFTARVVKFDTILLSGTNEKTQPLWLDGPEAYAFDADGTVEQAEYYSASGEIEAFATEANTKSGTVNGVPYIEKHGKIFKTGKHRKHNWTEADFDAVVEDFKARAPRSEIDWAVPIYEDHEDKQRRMVGTVRELYRKGKELFAVLRFSKAENVENVLCGFFRKLSASLYPTIKRLKEVSVTPEPHFDDTELYSASAVQTQTDSEEAYPVNKPTTETGVTAAQDADKGKAAETASQTKDAAPPVVVNFSAANGDVAEQMKAMNDKWEERFNAERGAREAEAAANKKLQDELESFRKENKANKACLAVEKYRAEGKVTKAMGDATKALVESLDTEQFALWEAAMAVTPQLVSYDTLGHTEATKPGAAADPEKSAERVASLTEKYGKGAH